MGRVSSIFSTAKIGEPAVTVPIIGKFIISFFGMSLHISSTSINSKALRLFVPFFMYPLSSNVFKWACTEDVELNSTALQISRIDGG